MKYKNGNFIVNTQKIIARETAYEEAKAKAEAIRASTIDKLKAINMTMDEIATIIK